MCLSSWRLLYFDWICLMPKSNQTLDKEESNVPQNSEWRTKDSFCWYSEYQKIEQNINLVIWTERNVTTLIHRQFDVGCLIFLTDVWFQWRFVLFICSVTSRARIYESWRRRLWILWFQIYCNWVKYIIAADGICSFRDKHDEYATR